jgi:hypothetical protein
MATPGWGGLGRALWTAEALAKLRDWASVIERVGIELDKRYGGRPLSFVTICH